MSVFNLKRFGGDKFITSVMSHNYVSILQTHK